LKIRIQIPILLLLLVLSACSDKSYNKEVLGRLEIKCKLEAIPDNIKANTSARKIDSKDSVTFTTEMIANCCGWYDQLILGEKQDTIYIKNLGKDDEVVMCDCSCLFELKIILEKSFAKNKKVLFEVRP